MAAALGSVQQAIELRPDLVLLCAGLVAKRAFRFRPQLGGRGLRLVMIQVVVTPSAAGLRVPFDEPTRVLCTRDRPGTANIEFVLQGSRESLRFANEDCIVPSEEPVHGTL